MFRPERPPFPSGSGRWPGTTLLVLAAFGAGLAVACQLDELLRSPPAGQGDSTPDQAVRLQFSVQPVNTTRETAIAPAVEVSAIDASGSTITTFDGSIVVGLASNPSDGQLSGVTTRPAVAGRAAFPDLTIDQPGSGYRMSASSSGLTPVTSDPFDVRSLPPSAMAAVSGDDQADTVAATLSDPYVVRVTDAEGAPVKGVEIRWATDGGSVAPAVALTDDGGEARAVHTVGTTTGEYSATASAPELPGRTVSFTATARPGAGAQLAFTQQPTDTERGKEIRPPVTVTVRDQFGNTATNYTSTVVMTIAPGTGTPGARLSGDRTRDPVQGVATFSGLKIDDFGLGYRLLASSGSLSATSDSFNVLLFDDDDDDDLLGALTVTSAHLALGEPGRIRR